MSNEYPPISIRCPTYGRPKFLNELVESFLRQDYKGKKELIILNDMPKMKYEFQHPEVKVVNQPERYGSHGEKQNAAMQMIKYDVTTIWDDDDIMLPWAISKSIERLGSKQFFMLGGYWRVFMRKKPDIKFMPAGIAPNAIYRKQLVYELGGFIENLPGSGEDTYFRGHVKKSGKYDVGILDRKEAFMIYRQGEFNFGRISRGKGGWEKFKDYYEKKNAPGTYVIEPCWEQDYVALTRKWIAEGI